MPSTALLKPRAIEVEAIGPNAAIVTMEPFERGYGHTLGNALRRILLSSMVGYAPTEAQITGVVHEYSTLDGVREDVVDILLNLKGVVFKLHNRDEVTLRLAKEGEGVVTAGDIELPHDVEIVNPDHVVAHLSGGGRLEMQLKVEKGRGYVPGNVRAFRDDHSKTIGRIVMDSSFSPVRRVSYAVEAARVGPHPDGPAAGVRRAGRHGGVVVDPVVAFAAGRSDPAAPRRRSRADGAFGQLPEGREHLLHRRPDPAHRERAVEDPEPGPDRAQRDQGRAGFKGPRPGHEAGELAARRSGARTPQVMSRDIARSRKGRNYHASPLSKP